MPDPNTQQLSRVKPGELNTDSLSFVGPRGDSRRHLSREALVAALEKLLPAPRDEGTLQLMVARGKAGERTLPEEVALTIEAGMPGDRWSSDGRYGPAFQLATTRFDYARLIANSQPPELHGDNLYLHLDLSSENLPVGSLLRLGQALLRVTPQAHNGCKKWVQRFGLAPMQLNLAPEYRHLHLRGIYLQVIEDGRVRKGDKVSVLERGARRP